MPGDAIQAREDPTDSLYVSDQTARSRLLAFYGLDQPLVEQYRRPHRAGRPRLADRLQTPVRKLIRQHF